MHAGDGGGFAARVDPELIEDMGHVGRYRPIANEERLSNLSIRVPLDEQTQYVSLSPRQASEASRIYVPIERPFSRCKVMQLLLANARELVKLV
jgi:hypothetical protein